MTVRALFFLVPVLLLPRQALAQVDLDVDLDVEAEAKVEAAAQSADETGGKSAAPLGSRVSSKLAVYTDDDDLTVVTPIVSFKQKIYDTTTLGLTYDADIFTAATVDVRTHASKEFEETRHGLAFSGSHRLIEQQLDLNAGLEFSREEDYSSVTASLGFAKEMLDKNLTLGGGYAFVVNAVGRSETSYDQYLEQLQIHALNASVTQVLDRETLLQISGSFIANFGYQASVYRYVPIFTSDSVDEGEVNAQSLADGSVRPVVRPPERLPDDRYRGAIVGRINRHFAGDFVLAADYRLYGDSWSVTSHTLSLKLYREFASGLVLRLRNRAYYQNGAEFYRGVYFVDSPEQLPQWYTIDRELSSYWYEMPGIKAAWKFGSVGIFDALTVDIKFDLQYTSYSDFNYLDSRWAYVGQIGTTVEL